MPFGGMLTAAAITSVAAPIVGGIVGHFASAGDRRRAREAMNRAYAEIQKLPDVGPDAAKHIVFRSLKDAGLYTPELEKVIEVEAPRLAEMALSSEFSQKQRAGLSSLKRMAETGLDTRAQFEEARLRGLQERKKELASIQQAEQVAGRAGGGSSLAAKIAGGISSSANIAEQALSANARQEEARRAALGDYMRGLSAAEEQRLGVEQTRLSAIDRFAQAQGVRRQDVQQRNIGAKREANLFNIRTGQADIQQRLAQDAQRAAAERQQYDDRVRMAQLRSNAALGQATQLQQQAGQTAGMWSGIGTGIGRVAGAYAAHSAKPSQKNPLDSWHQSQDRYYTPEELEQERRAMQFDGED